MHDACMDGWMDACISVCIYGWTNVGIIVFMHVHVCMRVYACMYLCMHAGMYVWMYVRR